MKEYVFRCEGKPYYSWKKCLQDFKHGEYAVVKNESDMTHNAFMHGLRYYLPDERVVSRKGVAYINPPIKNAVKIPGVLYYKGDWFDFVYSIEPRSEQQVINLTDDYKRNSDFVWQVNRALETNGIEGFKAFSVKGCCVLKRR